MANAWYYSVAGKQVGPVSGDVLKQMGAAGSLGREDLVRPEDTQQWVPARTVDGLFPQDPQATPLPAPTLPQFVEASQSTAANKSYKLPIIIASAVLLVVVGVVVGFLLTRNAGSGSGGAGNGSERVADPANSGGNAKVEDPDAALAKACVGSFTNADTSTGTVFKYSFAPTGIYTRAVEIHADNPFSVTWSGTWKVTNGCLVTVEDQSTYMMIKNGVTANMNSNGVKLFTGVGNHRVVSCDKAALVLEDDKGNRETYLRNL